MVKPPLLDILEQVGKDGVKQTVGSLVKASTQDGGGGLQKAEEVFATKFARLLSQTEGEIAHIENRAPWSLCVGLSLPPPLGCLLSGWCTDTTTYKRRVTDPLGLSFELSGRAFLIKDAKWTVESEWPEDVLYSLLSPVERQLYVMSMFRSEKDVRALDRYHEMGPMCAHDDMGQEKAFKHSLVRLEHLYTMLSILRCVEARFTTVDPTDHLEALEAEIGAYCSSVKHNYDYCALPRLWCGPCGGLGLEYAAAQRLQYACYAIYAKVDTFLLLGVLDEKEARRWWALRSFRPRHAFKHLSNMHYSEGLEQLLLVKAFVIGLMEVLEGRHFELRRKGEFLTENERGGAFIAACASSADMGAGVGGGFRSAAGEAGCHVLVQEMQQLRQMVDIGEITITEYEDRSDATLGKAEKARRRSQGSRPTDSMHDDADADDVPVAADTLF